MQAQVQTMSYLPNRSKYNMKKKRVLKLKSIQSVVFEQISTKFIEIFVP